MYVKYEVDGRECETSLESFANMLAQRSLVAEPIQILEVWTRRQRNMNGHAQRNKSLSSVPGGYSAGSRCPRSNSLGGNGIVEVSA